MFEKIRNSWVMFVAKVPEAVKIVIFALLICTMLFLLYKLLAKSSPSKGYDLGKLYWIIAILIITIILGVVGFFDFF